MRYTLLLLVGVAFSIPSEASACCKRRHSCYGGGYGGYSGCYGGGHHSGCYGGQYHGGHSHSGCYGHGTVHAGGCWGGGYSHGSTCQGSPQYQNLPAPSSNRSSQYFESGSNVSRTVRMEVIVNDPSASLTIQGATTTSTGTVRTFESPELEANKDYVYTVTLNRSNQEKDTRNITVRAGDKVVVDFTQPNPANPARTTEPSPAKLPEVNPPKSNESDNLPK